MPTTQMNVRIDQALKNAGDAAFKAAGYTPTQIVRDVWRFAEARRHDVEGIRALVDALRGTDRTKTADAAERERIAKFAQWLDAGPRQVRETCMRHNLNWNELRSLSPKDSETLLEEAYDEEIERLWSKQ